MIPKKVEKKEGPNLPLAASAIMALMGALIVGASFEVIKVYPLPVSVDPYFGFWPAAAWGGVVGAVCGLVLGYLTDDDYFPSSQ